MAERLEQKISLAATLRLEGGIRLSGELSSGVGGQLLLNKVKLVKAPEGGKVSLRPGVYAILSLDSSSDRVQVSIDKINNGVLVLEFANNLVEDTEAFLQTLTQQDTMPELVELSGASSEYTRLFRTVLHKSVAITKSLLESSLSEAYNYALDQSTAGQTSEEQRRPYYDATVTLRLQKPNIVNDALYEFQQYFVNLSANHTENESGYLERGDSEVLGLIDPEKFEGQLAIDRVVRAGEQLHNTAMEALLIRIATLAGVDPLNIRLPLHPRQICRAFQKSLEKYDIDHIVIPPLLDRFTRSITAQLGDVYGPLNALLIEEGLQPDLEHQITSQGTLLKRRTERHSPIKDKRPDPAADQTLADLAAANSLADAVRISSAATQMLNEASLAPNQISNNSHTGFHSPNLYQSVVNAMNYKRQADRSPDEEHIPEGTPISGTWDGKTVRSTELDQQTLANAQTIAQALGTIQRDSNVQAALQVSNSLREYLSQNKDQLGGLADTSGLTAESLNQLDMVDNLFDTIGTNLDVSSGLKPALGNLHIPLAKLALLDPQFFMDRGHAAREVVDKLSELANSANFPNRALEGRISAVVEDIVSDYEHDGEVFQRALSKIDMLITQQQRVLSRNVERVVHIQDGQERLLKARRAVGEVINERIVPPFAPRVLLDLVESGLRDLMVLTHVKDGPDSATWAKLVETLDQLCSWIDVQRQEELDDDQIIQRSIVAEDLIDTLGAEITSALPTNSDHQDVLQEIRDILNGDLEIETAEEGRVLSQLPEDPKRVRARVEDLPRLRRWVRRVEQLELGSWLTYKNQNGKKKRMQLAWTSEARDRNIFVNERGQKVADLSAVQLARMLSRGAKPPATADKMSVIDQSMYQTLEHVQKTLSFARNHDTLTQLINRDTFTEQMGRALRHAQQRNAQHALLLLNIDQFSLVNDVYDRVNGDQVLLEFGKLLSQLHGKKSSSARIESDEFAILLLDRPISLALQIAERVRTDIEASSVDIEGEKVSFTVSVSVVPIVEHSLAVEQLLESAQVAMRHAKDAGGNQVVEFSEDQSHAGIFKQDKSRTRESIEKALATERFVLRAQPIMQTAIDSRTPSSRHFELLLGLKNKDGGLDSPVEFIQSAERYGFMNLVDRWVVREAFTWISRLMDLEKEVPNLSINLSGSSVTDDQFMEYLLEQISEFGVGTSRICFEITETGTISNLVKAADFVRAFSNIGCKFSIDDFGTGLASHNYLRELPVDYVKIDGAFIRGIATSRKDYAMARSINDLAHFLGQETIAESVENDSIVEKLQEIGVDYLQGWGIGVPKVLEEVTESLSSIDR